MCHSELGDPKASRWNPRRSGRVPCAAKFDFSGETSCPADDRGLRPVAWDALNVSSNNASRDLVYDGYAHTHPTSPVSFPDPQEVREETV